MVEETTVTSRDGVPVEYTWDLTKIYATDAAWEQDIDRLDQMATELSALSGTLGQSAAQLLHALRQHDAMSSLLYQVYVYASLRRDSDGSDAVGLALAERAGSVVTRIAAAGAFVEPEILMVPDETLASWRQDEPGLAEYAYALDQLVQQRAHVRSPEVESILAEVGDITRAPGEIFEVLTDTDLQLPTILDDHNQPVALSHSRYSRFMENQDRRVRQDTFKGMFSSFGGIRTTLGTTLAAHIRGHVLNARLRGYPSALAAALEPNDLPIDVYHNLIATINANLPRLHRYMRVRKQLMGLDELHFYDLYAPLVPEVDVAMPYEAGADLIKQPVLHLAQLTCRCWNWP